MKKNNVLILLAVIFCLLSVFTACDTGVNPAKITRGGYGRISVNCAADEAKAARTVFPSTTAFDKYEYTFTKAGETTGTKKDPDNEGYFTLEVGTYTVTVEGYITGAPDILVARGTSASFNVGPGDNIPVEVRLSAVGGATQGKLEYTVTYPEGVIIDSITLHQWGKNDITLNYTALAEGNGVSESLDLDAGSYLLTVKVRKDGYRAGRSEAIRIYPGLTTVYTADFKDDDLLKICGSIAELKTLLEELPANTAAEAYAIALMNVSDLGGRYNTAGSLGYVLAANETKYVYLDLSGSTFTDIGNDAFRDCISLTGVTIPDSVESIWSGAFNNCSSLTSVTIPDSVTNIESSAFRNCTSLTSVTIGNSVTSIGSSTFYGCSGLTSVTIPNSVTSIGDRAFSGCSGLTAINVAAGNTAYISENGVLYNKNKTVLIQYPGGKTGAFTIPNSVTSIGEGAFYNCKGLTSVTIPDSVTSIGISAFYNCSKLTSVTIPFSVTTIRNEAFAFCSGLTSVTIPSGVTGIGNSAFYGCTSLTSITIGNSVTSIESNAFYGCTGLASVRFERNDTTTITNASTFPGDLVSKSGGTGAQNRYGTWTTTNPGSSATWTKQ